MASTAATATAEVTLREAEPGDAEACAQICFDAFGEFHDHHRFPRDFPVLEAATGMMAMWVPHPKVWGVVAEVDGKVVASNFLDERDPIRGVGPITVDPGLQSAGVGRRLMDAVLERGAGATGIRLVQDGFNMRSLYLYTSLGFEVKEPLAVASGKLSSESVDGVEVRELEEGDLDECAALCRRVHGFERTGDLRDSIQAFRPLVALRDGRIAAYGSAPAFWQMNHGVAENDEDMKALLLGASAKAPEPITFLAPLRSPLFAWSLREGLRLLKPMNLMALGEYQEPRGSWYPSVLY